MRRMTLAFALLAFLLAGCASLSGQQAPQKTIITACNAYASALTTASRFRAAGRLGDTAVSTVNNVVTLVHPICSAKTIPSTADALSDVQNGIETLTEINQQAAP